MPRAKLIATTSAGEKLRATRADSSRGRAIAPERKEMERTEKKVATEKRMVTYVCKMSWSFGRRKKDKDIEGEAEWNAEKWGWEYGMNASEVIVEFICRRLTSLGRELGFMK
jgi:hypothetical protein